MPDTVKRVLEDQGVWQAYKERPAYQQNDYIGWIERARREQTKGRRLAQMIAELKIGGVYMKMKHSASAKK